MIGAAVLALIFSFFQFYKGSLKTDISGAKLCRLAGQSASTCADSTVQKQISEQYKASVASQGSETFSAWHGFFGWFGILLLLIAAVNVAATIFGVQLRASVNPRLASLGLSVLGLVFIVIAAFVIPIDTNGIPDDLVNLGHGFSYWIVLILAVVTAALAGLRFTQTKGETAGGAPLPPPPGAYPPPPAPESPTQG